MSSAAPPAPERLSADARREALLDATRALLRDVGPGGATMGLVAERAGVTRALVYKHFANSDELLVALYRREATRVDREIRARVEAAPDGFEPKLRAFIDATLEVVVGSGPTFAPLRGAAADAEVRGEARRRDRRTVGWFVALAVEELGIDERTARTVISVLFTGIRSLISQSRSRPGAAEHRFLVDTYVEMTVGALTRLAV